MGIRELAAPVLVSLSALTSGCATDQVRPPIVTPFAPAEGPIDYRINMGPFVSAVDSQRISLMTETPVSVWESQFGKGNATMNLYTVPTVDGYAFEMEDKTGSKYAYAAWDKDNKGVWVRLPGGAKKYEIDDGSGLLIYSVTNEIHVPGYLDTKDGVKGEFYPELGVFIYFDMPAEKKDEALRFVFGIGDKLAELVREEGRKAEKTPFGFALNLAVDPRGGFKPVLVENKGGKIFVYKPFP